MEGRNYQTLNTLATGGTAVLYKAIQTSLGREVVIKRLHSHLTSDSNFTGRFEQEARTAASLDHENIVRIIDSGVSKDNYFIVMEYIDGITLKELLERNGVIDEETVLLIAYEICLGLDHAHQRGIIHRDIKPANIMINREGQVKITDFGLAKLTQTNLEQTVADTLLGTPLYMSPEQAIGEGIDGRSDLFSLGTVCYEMMTDTQPFTASNYAAVIQNIINGEFAPISSVKDGGDRESESIVMKAMNRDPGKRFRTALEMARTIEDMLGHEKVMDARHRLKRLVAGQNTGLSSTKDRGDNDSSKVRNTKRSGNRIKKKSRGEYRRRSFLPAAFAAVMMTIAAVYLVVSPDRIEMMKMKLRELRSTSPVSADNSPVIFAQGFTGDLPLAIPDDAPGSVTDNPDTGDPSGNVETTVEDNSPADSDHPATDGKDPTDVGDYPVGGGSDPVQVKDDPATEEADLTGHEAKEQATEEIPAIIEPFGFIDIEVEPEADIIIDGVFRVSGNRYGPVEIDPGHHRIICRQKDFTEYSETVNITVGELSKRRILLRQKTGYLSFETDTGARIFVNGRFIGITPLPEVISLTSGKHMVEMKKAGFRDWTSEVFIPSDETVKLKISLSPL